MTTITEATIAKTASHQPRTVRHTPNETGKGTHDATVTVAERTGVRVVRHLLDTYLVEEVPAVGFSGRMWLILKDRMNGASLDTVKGTADAERIGSVYECRVFDGEPGKRFGTCTCDGAVASKGRNKCVHFLALSALVDAGLPSIHFNAEADFFSYEEPAHYDPEPATVAPPKQQAREGRPAYATPPDQDMW